jgi:ribose-phosphate pyrophosphokinase
LSQNAIENIKKSKISQVVCTNTIPLDRKNLGDKFVVLSAGTLLAEAIRRIHLHESLSEIFI